MIGISMAAKKEREVVLNRFNMRLENCEKYPFGEYFITTLYDKEIVFYRCGVRKLNAQYQLNI